MVRKRTIFASASYEGQAVIVDLEAGCGDLPAGSPAFELFNAHAKPLKETRKKLKSVQRRLAADRSAMAEYLKSLPSRPGRPTTNAR